MKIKNTKHSFSLTINGLVFAERETELTFKQPPLFRFIFYIDYLPVGQAGLLLAIENPSIANIERSITNSQFLVVHWILDVVYWTLDFKSSLRWRRFAICAKKLKNRFNKPTSNAGKTINLFHKTTVKAGKTADKVSKTTNKLCKVTNKIYKMTNKIYKMTNKACKVINKVCKMTDKHLSVIFPVNFNYKLI